MSVANSSAVADGNTRIVHPQLTVEEHAEMEYFVAKAREKVEWNSFTKCCC